MEKQNPIKDRIMFKKTNSFLAILFHIIGITIVITFIFELITLLVSFEGANIRFLPDEIDLSGDFGFILFFLGLGLLFNLLGVITNHPKFREFAKKNKILTFFLVLVFLSVLGGIITLISYSTQGGEAYIAVKEDNVEKLKSLYAADDVSMSDEKLLDYAAQFKSEEVVHFLIDRGANVNYIKENGGSIFTGAIYHGTEEIIKAFIEAGADPNALDSMYNPAFLCLIYSDRPVESKIRIAEILLEKGADLSYKEDNGQSLAEIAELLNQHQLVEWIKSHQ